MKKILIASCLVIALCAGCKKPKAPEPAPTTPEQPATTAGQTVQTTQTAPGGTAAPTGQVITTKEGNTTTVTTLNPPQTLPDKERCDLLQQKYFQVQLERLKITVEYKQKMLDVYKKSGTTPESNIEVGRLSQEMEQKLTAAVVAQGFKSSADLNPAGCPNFDPGKLNQDPQINGQFQEQAKKLSEIDQQIIAITNPSAAPKPATPAPVPKTP